MTTLQVQLLLKYLGYDVAPDGVYGNQTRAAVREFQEDYGGIAVDGDAGEQTQKALRDAVAYNKFKPPDTTTEESSGTGTFWDDIQYFTREEYGIACPCGRCGGFPVEPEEKLMRLADKVRGYFDRPVRPSSTVRCQAHNDELPNSVPNSRHVRGKAMDFTVAGMPSSLVLGYVQHLSGVRYAYAIDGSYVHMDVE